MKTAKKLTIIICILSCLVSLIACGAKQEIPENAYSVYYISNSETKVENHEYILKSENLEEQVQELILVLQTNPASLQYKAPLSMGFTLLDYKIQAGKVNLNVDQAYTSMPLTKEVLVRAAIVKTLTQLKGINFVSITVEGSALKDAKGATIGWMNRDQFLENEGSSFNTYEEVTMKLYFSDETGTGLMETTRTKEYSSNVSMEKMIVEELIKGPNGEGIYATINPQTKVASVTVQDRTCYVNLDETFLTQVPNVKPEVTIYSIVNSLVALSNVDKVQISVNGDTSITYRDKFKLDMYFEKNQELVINDQ